MACRPDSMSQCIHTPGACLFMQAPKLEPRPKAQRSAAAHCMGHDAACRALHASGQSWCNPLLMELGQRCGPICNGMLNIAGPHHAKHPPGPKPLRHSCVPRPPRRLTHASATQEFDEGDEYEDDEYEVEEEDADDEEESEEEAAQEWTGLRTLPVSAAHVVRRHPRFLAYFAFFFVLGGRLCLLHLCVIFPSAAHRSGKQCWSHYKKLRSKAGGRSPCCC
jgi:hypothetical protein